LVIILAAVSSFISLPYYALTPGVSQNVAPLISVPPDLQQHHTGTVSLVDVEETPIRLIDFLWFKLDGQASIVSSAAIQGPETNAQYYTEGVLDMSDAQQAAQVVALRTLGYDVKAANDGALIYAIDPGSPADTSLAVGDVITGIDSTKVVAVQDLTTALDGRSPGSDITVTYRPYPSKPATKTVVRLGAWRYSGRGNNLTIHCVPVTVNTLMPYIGVSNGAFVPPKAGVSATPAACLGLLQSEQWYHVSNLPFPVNLNSEGIVGPSAGLSFTLGLIQKLNRADLTGGIKVACTGTMSIDGQVGPIGGVEQKTFAVRNAGDKIFLVPAANFAEAKKYEGPDLKVYSVSTIQQAISILESYGGKIVKPASAP
jgi:PDZ domain-containing protein